MSRSSLHGGGFSAVEIEPCVGVPVTSRQKSHFAVYGAEGFIGSARLLDRTAKVDERLITVEIEPRAAEQASREGLKFYCRLAPSSKADGQPKPADLDELAELLKTFVPTSGPTLPDTDIPAAYTYLGQFIAHELSDLKVLDGASIQVRSAALDLDSLFGAVQKDPLPGQAQIWKGGVGIGQARSDGPDVRYEDLPRRCDGMALIADQRNDSNLALAQLHLTLSKFHQFVAQHEAGRSDEEARRITRRHVQSVVLHDYLRRVIEPGVYDDILLNGRSVIHRGGLKPDNPFLIPIEFAAACFRVGHSMVRDLYANWEYEARPARLMALLKFTGGGKSFGNLHHLSHEWKINWASMLDGLGPGSQVNMAGPIDLQIAEQMHILPNRLFMDDAPPNVGAVGKSIARATLAKQRLLELSSGQLTAAAVNAAIGGGLQIPVLSPQEIISALSDGGVSGTSLAQFLQTTGMHQATPLWLYCLAESRALCDGQRFGPLTSRIVMETIHAAIEASQDGIIGKDGKQVNFTAAESLSGQPHFLLLNLIVLATQWPA